MSSQGPPPDKRLEELQEREKELRCLYTVDEILNRPNASPDEVFHDLVRALPPGWRFPEICQAACTIGDRTYRTDGFEESPWVMQSRIMVRGRLRGTIEVSYRESHPGFDTGPFLDEERRLIRAIAERIGLYLLHRTLEHAQEDWKRAADFSERQGESWRILIEFLGRTEPAILKRITRRMIHHLGWNAVPEAGELLQEELDIRRSESEIPDPNRPLQKQSFSEITRLTERTFEIATRHLGEADVVSYIQTWINEEHSSFLLESLENPASSLAEISESMARYRNADIDESKLSPGVRTGIKVGLLSRLFVDQLDFVNVAKNHVEIGDFHEVIDHLVYPSRSRGRIGGKGAGLFVASQIMHRAPDREGLCGAFKVPKTWFIASDGVLDFIQYNNLTEVYNRKYLEVDRIRHDYPYTIQIFKNSRFSPEMIKGLSTALDDFEDRPLIVRSSSMLEDRMGASFSGKYKSLFLANQGAKRARLAALLDAVAEVYASVFGPDPIEYRAERGLLDFREEMGIMLQEVVGKRVGRYFLPAFAGVAFSINEFRWSPRIRREDGLIRLVPGLGTRAVDRMSDDYPVLVSPGQPSLRANVSPREILRYSPRKMDVINLEANRFETVDIRDLFGEFGGAYPEGRQLISMVDEERIREPMGREPDWKRDDYLVTFEGLIRNTPFLKQMSVMLQTLAARLRTPVDVEFACDGDDLYVLQCRSQSQTGSSGPAVIPADLPRDKILFTANRFVSNGEVGGISHIVYVDPEEYGNLPDSRSMERVARAVGRINKALPRHRFILMGPGRWGSRGDIRLGVGVGYADISNCAVLIEIARRKKSYVPELSFGTHFFQDLVEAGIHYLPLYPDEPEVIFNEAFLTGTANRLGDLAPEFADLGRVVRVIDVPAETPGLILRVFMNGDQEKAVGAFVHP